MRQRRALRAFLTVKPHTDRIYFKPFTVELARRKGNLRRA
jgi:hypothetical protein